MKRINGLTKNTAHQQHEGSPTNNPAYLLDMLPTAIYMCDNDGKLTYYNEAAVELWGRRPVLAKDLWCGSFKVYDLHGKRLPDNAWPMAIALDEKRALLGEEIIIEKQDGERMNILCHPKPIFDDEGKMTGALNILIDITDQKHLISAGEEKYRSLFEVLEKKVEERTETLKRSEERYHKMVDEVQDYAILLLNKDGYILNWNKGAEKIKGYTESDIIGKNFRLFYLETDRKDKLPERLIDEASRTGRAAHEGWRVRKDGSRFWGSVVITALHGEDNSIIGFSKVTRDLTERKLAEDQMNNYLRDIEFRNKQLEEYAYVASHDLQEPLRKIQIFAELLEDNINDPDAIRHNLGKINSSAKRMANLIKDVLQYSQLSVTDQLYTDTDLNKIIDTIREDYTLIIEQKNVKIQCKELPVIQGIPIQLHQLFANLISNAIKFSSENPYISISSTIVSGMDTGQSDLLPGRNYAKIIFEDNGVGFEQQYAEQIFKMFKRLTSKSGTGIGLALCKKIVENHNGHIMVNSIPDEGTTFTIYLPLINSRIN